MEYDLYYRVSYEKRQSAIDLGPTEWLCPHTTLPDKLIQEATTKASSASSWYLGNSVKQKIQNKFGDSETDDNDNDVKTDGVKTSPGKDDKLKGSSKDSSNDKDDKDSDDKIPKQHHDNVISGRHIRLRDHFGFAVDDLHNMEHDMLVQIKETSFFR
jgi:hypothetical protein